jgi:hypothetical protein
MLIGRAWKEHRAGRRWPAVATGLRAAMIRPFSLSAWKSVVALMIKRGRSAPEREHRREYGND